LCTIKVEWGLAMIFKAMQISGTITRKLVGRPLVRHLHALVQHEAYEPFFFEQVARSGMHIASSPKTIRMEIRSSGLN
jgi:hypothetical protein